MQDSPRRGCPLHQTSGPALFQTTFESWPAAPQSYLKPPAGQSTCDAGPASMRAFALILPQSTRILPVSLVEQQSSSEPPSGNAQRKYDVFNADAR